MIPQFPEFKKLELSDRKDIESITQDLFPYSDFNFTSLYSWNIYESIEISILNEVLVVCFFDYLSGKKFYSCAGKAVTNETFMSLIAFAKEQGCEAQLRLVPEECVQEISKDIFAINEEKGSFDYLYDVASLAMMEGSQYEYHRAMVRRFERMYPHAQVEVVHNLETISEGILALEERWRASRDSIKVSDGVDSEERAIQRILQMKDIDIYVTCVFQDNNLIAFCINEYVRDKKWIVSHFAKADLSFEGISMFLFKKNAGYGMLQGVKYMNYEQDLDIEGLRLSKMRLRPVGFLKKFTVSLKSN